MTKWYELTKLVKLTRKVTKPKEIPSIQEQERSLISTNMEDGFFTRAHFNKAKRIAANFIAVNVIRCLRYTNCKLSETINYFAQTCQLNYIVNNETKMTGNSKPSQSESKVTGHNSNLYCFAGNEIIQSSIFLF